MTEQHAEAPEHFVLDQLAHTPDQRDILHGGDFDSLRITLPSDEERRSWSYGEVTLAETMNASSGLPVFGGLFCQRIFGPTRSLMCFCGHLKGEEYEGTKCPICHVDCVNSSARKERMGHIELAAPVAHTWYARGAPNKMALLLNIQVDDLRAVIGYKAYLALDIDKTALEREIEREGNDESEEAQRWTKILETILARGVIPALEGSEVRKRLQGKVTLETGAAVIRKALERINLDELYRELLMALEGENEEEETVNVDKTLARLRAVAAFIEGDCRPENMIMTTLPVLPPDMRPIVEMGSGQIASSDLNDLYLLVLRRNKRVKRMIAHEGTIPDLMIWAEKRLLQAAVDALYDNGRDGRATSRNGRPLRSLAEMLKGKPGRFRQNLLGKRVDFSGRSVIVSGPELRMNQCGLPRKMALELYKPFVMARLMADSKVDVRGRRHARRMVERQSGHSESAHHTEESRIEEEAVWGALDEAVKGHPVLLNRAPTLHRLGMQAFYPVLIEGNAIKLHPLVTTSFNADFDGDQMAVHLPISHEAIEEARTLMINSANMLSPSSGEAILAPSLDMVLGCYYLTMAYDGLRGHGKQYLSTDDALLAYEFKHIELHAKIWVTIENEWVETTVGRILFNQALAGKIPYQNATIDKKGLKRLTAHVAFNLPVEDAMVVLDGMKDAGFYYAGAGGVTIAISDIEIPKEKDTAVADAEKIIERLRELYLDGCLSDEGMYDHTIAVWTDANDKVTQYISDIIEAYGGEDVPEERRSSTGIGLYMMASSGAKGNLSQIKQMSGMRGLMADPSGRTIERPIKTSFREGLSVLDYFISSHGARKGLTDTALRTADSGYLTRRLIDVMQYMLIKEADCGDADGFWVDATAQDKLLPSFDERTTTRYLASAAFDRTGKLIAEGGTLITEALADRIEQEGSGAMIRSPASCKAVAGLCQMCYGLSLATRQLPRIGEAVGIIAAQAIGEPGTQLTMRTFHTGGVAGADITSGLPRVQELVEARPPKGKAVLAPFSGYVTVEDSSEARAVTITPHALEEFCLTLPPEGEIIVQNGQTVAAGEPLARVRGEIMRAPFAEQVFIYGQKQQDTLICMARKTEEQQPATLTVPQGLKIIVQDDDHVGTGEALSEGSKDLQELLDLTDAATVQRYIVDEIQKVYRGQGVETHDKHIEIVVRLMLEKSVVSEMGDSDHLVQDIVRTAELEAENAKLLMRSMQPIQYTPTIQGITRVASSVPSFLSAASFQETVKALTDAAVRSADDPMVGLKENVILGRLIPARFD